MGDIDNTEFNQTDETWISLAEALRSALRTASTDAFVTSDAQTSSLQNPEKVAAGERWSILKPTALVTRHWEEFAAG